MLERGKSSAKFKFAEELAELRRELKRADELSERIKNEVANRQGETGLQNQRDFDALMPQLKQLRELEGSLLGGLGTRAPATSRSVYVRVVYSLDGRAALLHCAQGDGKA